MSREVLKGVEVDRAKRALRSSSVDGSVLCVVRFYGIAVVMVEIYIADSYVDRRVRVCGRQRKIYRPK